MSSERIVHSERTNGALPSGEMGTNSGDKEIEGRWMKGGHRRQRVAYNWRNNRQEFVLGDTGRKRMLVYRACFEIIFPSKQKPLSFCCLQSCCVSPSQQCDVAVMPVATWCTCQELFRPNGKKEIQHIIWNLCQCLVPERPKTVCLIIKSCYYYHPSFHWRVSDLYAYIKGLLDSFTPCAPLLLYLCLAVCTSEQNSDLK